jgi:nucleoside 2-deoxyribosyltransferase
MKSVYIIGSLRNEKIPQVGNLLRANGWDAFDDWYGAGHEADDKWRDYENLRGRTHKDALFGYAARHVFAFDQYHLKRCDIAVLVMPAGKSGHLELGYFVGLGKPGFILFDGIPDRYDVMHQFATDVFNSQEELIQGLEAYRGV